MSRDDTLTKVRDAASTRGYSVDETSVDNKNQTRFIHLQLSKDNERFFGKVNIRAAQLLDLKNESLSTRLADGTHFTVVKPIEQIEIGDTQILLVYPYIDVPAISTEQNEFEDFTVTLSNQEAFFKAAEEMIHSIETSDFYSSKDLGAQTIKPRDQIISWLKEVDPGASYAVIALQQLSKTLPESMALAPSTGDPQPQNLFWDQASKQLFLIDLESLRNMPIGFDRSMLAASIYTNNKRPDIALAWVSYCIQSLRRSEQTNQVTAISQLHTMLLWAGIEHYTHFRRIHDAGREQIALDFIKWCLYDFESLVND